MSIKKSVLFYSSFMMLQMIYNKLCQVKRISKMEYIKLRHIRFQMIYNVMSSQKNLKTRWMEKIHRLLCTSSHTLCFKVIWWFKFISKSRWNWIWYVTMSSDCSTSSIQQSRLSIYGWILFLTKERWEWIQFFNHILSYEWNVFLKITSLQIIMNWKNYKCDKKTS